MKKFLSKITAAATLLLLTLAATAQTPEATRLNPRNSEFNRPPVDRKALAEQVEVLKPMSRSEAMKNRLRAPMSAPMRPAIKKAASRADVPNLRGAVIFADSWGKNNHPYGLYNIA
ncbi:MAG: hypothetical protein K2G40_01205, partial [Muribaculaceae bacterium]|nr:hypothetical protein [Muribaculaceae bacterium]